MANHTTYHPVNWIDGMKINKNHFIAERNALQQQIASAVGAHITTVNYGLLPYVANEQKPFNIHASLDNQQHVQIRLVNCRAITAGGYVVHIEDGNHVGNHINAPLPELITSYDALKHDSTSYFVILTIDVYDRVPTGIVDEKEIPPRLPYAIPKLTLSILPEAECNQRNPGLYQLILARLVINEGRLELDGNYIPPCVACESNEDLTEIFYGLEEFLSKMELYALQINQKVIQKKQNNDMAVIVQNICNNIIQYTNTNFAHFKWTALQSHPAFMISHTAGMARLIRNNLDLYVNAGKEELVNYFVEWCDINQGKLESVMVDLCNLQYNHQDINASIEKISDFTKVISSLFYKLSKLDYIGKKRDANIFVKEEKVEAAPSENLGGTKRKSFLAD